MTPITTTQIPGGFIVPNDTHIGKWQIESGRLDHDNFLPPFVVSRLKPADFVIDCGAFDGDHTIAYSNAVGPDGLVVAIEAGNLAFECLKHNAKLFKHRNVLTVHAAAGEIDGVITSHYPAPNLGASQCVADGKDGDFSVSTITIDKMIGNLDRKVSFIKMDIEGWEFFALRGAEGTIKKDRPEMLIEINRGALASNHHTPEDVVKFIIDLQYAFTILPSHCRFLDPQFDIHCIPK